MSKKNCALLIVSLATNEIVEASSEELFRTLSKFGTQTVVLKIDKEAKWSPMAVFNRFMKFSSQELPDAAVLKLVEFVATKKPELGDAIVRAIAQNVNWNFSDAMVLNARKLEAKLL